MKVNFQHFKAACMLAGLEVNVPIRCDATRLWLYFPAWEGNHAATIAREICKGFGIEAKDYRPKRVEKHFLEVEIAVFDSVPLRRRKEIMVEHTFPDGGTIMIRRRVDA